VAIASEMDMTIQEENELWRRIKMELWQRTTVEGKKNKPVNETERW
jgi:hypothetical protein